MSEHAVLAWFLHMLRRRRRVETALYALAAGALTCWAASTVSSWPRALAAGLACAAIAAWVGAVYWRARKLDLARVAGYLDGRDAALEDSTGLLLAAPRELTPLARLQRARVAERVAHWDEAARRARLPPWPVSRMAGVLGAMSLVALVGVFASGRTIPQTDRAAADAVPRVIDARVQVTPPAYTGRGASRQQGLDVATVEGAALVWRLTLDAPAQDVQLVTHDEDRIALRRDGERAWRSEPWRARPVVYRVVADGVDARGGVARVDAARDDAPRIEVLSPQQNVRVVPADGDGPGMLSLRLRAQDDYGVTAVRARVTLARGSGEQVRFRERAIDVPFDVSGEGRVIDARWDADLAEFDMTPGDEFYLFVEVEDNRAGEPNVAVSGTFVVRWLAPESGARAVLDAMAVNVLPEYFRSQRQIILDTEALIAARGTLDTARFAERAQALAIDQRLLRLRYGAFLGEEADSGIGAQVGAGGDGDDDDGHGDGDQHDDEAAHDDLPAVGEDPAANAIALYAHFHDRAEQATLFEPATRELLRSALAAMWDAELPLRQARPEDALAHEYTALELIKRVQQSARIYARRAGFAATPIDESRRLTGELDEVAGRRVDAGAGRGDAARLRAFLARLTDARAAPSELARTAQDLDAAVRALARLDAHWLTALGAMQRLQRDPQCVACRRELAQVLWRKLPPAPPALRAADAPPSPFAAAPAREP